MTAGDDRATLVGLRYRRPTPADHARLSRAAEAWLGERRPRPVLPRLWLRDFAGTGWIADTAADELAGFALAYHSASRTDEAVLQVVAVAPSLRRRGIGRALVDRVVADARSAVRHRLVTVVWPGDPACLRFLRAQDFTPEGGPGSMRLYGTDAWPDYDGPGEDRAVLVLAL